MLVWVASYPRSGNTLFRIVLHRTYGVPTASLYRGETEETGPLASVARAMGAVPLPLRPDELAERPERWFVKTHELPTPTTPQCTSSGTGGTPWCPTRTTSSTTTAGTEGQRGAPTSTGRRSGC